MKPNKGEGVDTNKPEIYRIRHIPTGAWWQGEAKSAQEAVGLAVKESCQFCKGTLDIKIKTYNGSGGWRKVKYWED